MKYRVPISIIMPCYNNGRYVSKAIESLLQQSFPYFEFIIIDDGSTDNSLLEIIKYTDNRIHFHQIKENKGNYFARNMGIRLAKGKYICMMDADDIAQTERLKIQHDYLDTHPNIGAIGAQGEVIDENGALLNGKISKPICQWSQLKTFLLLDNYILHSSLMIRSCLLQKHCLFYNEKYRYASDFDFVSRCAHLFSVRNIENTLIMYRVHSMQISSKKNTEQRNYADQIRLAQLQKFNIRLTQVEKKIYLQMIRINLSSMNELEKGLDIFNKILSCNQRQKLYNSKFLYQLFDYILSLNNEKLRFKKSEIIGENPKQLLDEEQ